MKNVFQKNRFIYGISGLIAVCFLVALDQWTKLLAVNHLKGNAQFDLIPKVLCFRYLENNGAAFSMLEGKMTLFFVLTPIICLAIIYLYLQLYKLNGLGALRIISVFIIAGALGNYIDRISYRYVIDFIYFELIDFPIFNVADIYVTCSMVVLIFLILFKYKDSDLEQIKIFPKKNKK